MYLFEDKKYDKRNFLTSSILLGFPENPGEYFSTLFTSLKNHRLIFFIMNKKNKKYSLELREVMVNVTVMNFLFKEINLVKKQDD